VKIPNATRMERCNMIAALEPIYLDMDWSARRRGLRNIDLR
jgi:hypothetical protein